MTSQFKNSLSGLIASILIFSNTFAQQPDMKSLQSLLSKGTYVKVYDNIMTEFQKHFANAQNVQWEKLQENFLAKFSIDGVDHRALMSPKGQLKYKNTYGTEKLLPTDIRKAVKKNYVEFAVKSTVHVEEDNRSIWVINLEDEANYVIVRVENNEIEEVGKYKKAK